VIGLAGARSLLARVAAAAGGFPDVSEQYREGFYWPESEHALDFPKAAALIPTIYGCINRISQDTASVMPEFHRGRGNARKKIEREPGNIADLIARANPVQSGYELERDRQWSCDQNGNGYLFLEDFGRPRDPAAWELWVMPGHLMRVIAGPRRTIARYEFGQLGIGTPIDPEKVIPFRYPNPDWNPLEPAPIGLSPLEAARQAYETRFEMAKWQRDFFQRGAMGGMVFNVKDRISIEDKDVKKMQETMDRRFGGANRQKPVFLAGVEFVRAGLTQEEMRFLETAALSDADICRVYGIPPVLMVIKDGGGLSDAGATTDMLIYWQHCIVPRVMLRDAVLTEWLCPRFGADVVCETDLSRVLPLQEAMLKQAESIVKLTGRPVLTVNQALERLRLPRSESPTADALAVPFAVIIEGTESARAPAPASPAPVPEPKPAAASRLALSAGERRRALARRADADLARYERRVESLFVDFFSEQERAALARLSRQARAAGVDVQAMRLAYDADELLDPRDEQDAARLQRIYSALIAERGEAAAAEIRRELVLDVASGRVALWIGSQSERALTQTNDTTRRALHESLAEGVNAQESYPSLVGRVRSVFDDRRANAATIARTETMPGYNFAALEAWRALEVQQKEWLTVDDDAVRDAHREADGQVVAIDGAFRVGDEDLLYPGDPSGAPGNTINCRCIVQPVVSLSGLARYFRAAAPSTNGRAPHTIRELVAA
jgi:HK97 family phage portal protein